MHKLSLLAVLFLILFTPAWAAAQDSPAADTPAEEVEAEDGAEVDPFYDDPFLDEGFEEEAPSIADPLEPVNRAFFVFNDKLYFWVLKPAARGYAFVVPEGGRVAVRRFFSNLTTPIRLVNAVLQLKLKRAGTELARFGINTTVGVLGFMDPARDRWRILKHDEDLGQTFGRWGSGGGLYLTLPVLGPSNVRDAVGRAGDTFLNPLTYIFAGELYLGLAVRGYEQVNETSLEIGTYEDIKRDALDPYIFIRNAYHQHRQNAIKE